jgi:ATP-dependent RNA/DNA helicase IGHMBP2
MVRSNLNNELGFLKEWRRLNVAVTRAKKRLIIVGDSETLKADKFIEGLLNYIENHGEIRSA